MATAAEQPEQTLARRHDLDALRGFAMLLGIVLHAGLSFIPGVNSVWAVQDSQTMGALGLVFASIHGFRMPLFFLISGFFTAMLWRKRGLKALLWHRFRRIFLPMILALFTIMPLTFGISAFIKQQEAPPQQQVSQEATETSPSEDQALVTAVALGKVEDFNKQLELGANIEQRDQFGSTPLHVAAFFGRNEMAKELLAAGADKNALNAKGETPDAGLNAPFETVAMVSSMFQIPLKENEWAQGQLKIAKLLEVELSEERIADLNRRQKAESKQQPTAPSQAVIALLMTIPLLGHLWFLWFLCVLVTAYAILVFLGKTLNISLPARSITMSWGGIAGVILLTAIPQYYMEFTETSTFGPATSLGFIPNPAVLLFYAIFFLFGSLYFDAEDSLGTLGKTWWALLPVGLVILFAGLGASTMKGANPAMVYVSVGCQAIYAWIVSLGMMGLCRKFLSTESPKLRYLSDSSYWLYLAHLPLVIYLQHVVSPWPWNPLLKLFLICLVSTIILLISYQWCVRYTPVGTLLNGRRKRTEKLEVSVAVG